MRVFSLLEITFYCINLTQKSSKQLLYIKAQFNVMHYFFFYIFLSD